MLINVTFDARDLTSHYGASYNALNQPSLRPPPMPELIAQGPKLEHRWRRRLSAGQSLCLGREAGVWSITWDEHVSRRHAEILLAGEQLSVERLPTAVNPIFFRGSEQDGFHLLPGEHFVIGATTFTLVDEQLNVTQDSPAPVTEQTISYELLQQIRFDDADRRLDVLSSLPETLSTAASDSEQAQKLLTVLLTAITSSSFVALAEVTEAGDIVVRQWDRRDLEACEVLPSERLIRQAVDSRASVIHVWPQGDGQDASFTQHEGEDWAFCVPLRDAAASQWVAYVAGTFDQPAAARRSLEEDVKFVDLACQTLGQLQRLRRLERERASLGQFISPVVMDALGNQDPEVALAPREAQVSVLFCDLRGFSRRSEQESDDLMELLQRVSGALGVMTRQILEHGGVIGDFHGDSAMGFWGWPIEQADAPLRACQAALCIRREFDRAAKDHSHALADFRMGIGIASGRAVAGKIGTVDQVKVTVFGPVVNIAARLEGMTKTLRAPILIDAETAEGVRGQLAGEVGRLRRVARVRPAGMQATVDVSELLAPAAASPVMPNEGITAYEEALDALQALEWDKAFAALHRVPAEDRVKDFLTVFIAQHNRTPPDDWDGVIPISVK
jgi:adenylate cyclase